MKKILGVLLIIVFLAIPMGAFATPFLKGQEMDVNASGPNAVGWLGDYDVTSNPLGGITEVFCVENADMWGDPKTQYDFYHITVADVGQGKYDQLAEATWYANWFVNSGGSDNEKVAAQVAVWNAMDMRTGIYSAIAEVVTIFNALPTYNTNLNDAYAYVSDWSLAVSPADGGANGIDWTKPGQNYLVQNPVPEPATMVLFGIGLLGLARIGRKKTA